MRPTRLCIAAFAATAVPSFGCSDDFAPYNKLDGLRVMAIRAEPPWPGPQQASDLSALVYAPDGNGSVQYAWSWCPVSLGASAAYACAIDEEALAAAMPSSSFPPFDLGSAATATFEHQLDAEDLQSLCGARATLAASSSCEGHLDGFVKLLVRQGEERVAAVRQMRLRTAASSQNNANPLLSAVGFERLINAGTQTAFLELPATGEAGLPAGSDIELVAHASADSAEIYDDTDPFGRPEQSRERLVATWFVSAGQTDLSRTVSSRDDDPTGPFTNTWSLPDLGQSEDGEEMSLFIVLRDGRGGVDWEARLRLLAEPQI